MEVILIEELANLGSIGELVKVAPGYARNFLFPRKMAISANTKNKRQLDHQMRIANFRREKAKTAAMEVAKKINGMILKIARKVGEQEKLFGSVTAHDVHEALLAQGVNIDRRKLELHEPIKTLGDYHIGARLAGDVRVTVKVSVIGE